MTKPAQPTPGIFTAAVQAAEDRADARPREADGTVQYRFPDYETYRQVQTDGNKAKIRAQFVTQPHIFALADWLKATYGAVSFGLCHGVRRGKEQKWFRRRLTGRPDIVGTDISDTAGDFPATVQWDFHDENPDWAGRADFVYTNSWDHAFEPERAFRAWHAALKPGGVLMLDHTRGHLPTGASALDPFGATWEALIATVGRALGDGIAPMAQIDRMDADDYPARTLVMRKV